ncbi:uncharacterized protein LOC6544461 [Drosophila erecta]|uniref:Uncharacterized protein n=1 Tax=Drosophila erecta TaxID=7220 RepID=B3NDK8_DROER|nr:uncharacterized protein LOC6544461 [Drosophila erecta]EDV52141.2 uncharacterized protein Dere_GG15917 [Drosophila erecta]
MPKISLFVAFICLFVIVYAQSDRDICKRLNDRCDSRVLRNGRNNDVSNIFNENCRRSNRNWRDISRCELAKANCILTLERCDTVTCENVRRVLA